MRMSLRKRWSIWAAGIAISSLAIPASFAGTSTQSMNVSITITGACTTSVTDINFGSVPATTLSSSLTSTTAQGGLLTYNCSTTATTPTLTAN